MFFSLRFLLCLYVFSALGCSAHDQPDTQQNELKVRTLTEQNLLDILVGACIQSTRNCDPSPEIERVKAALSAGKTFTTIAIEDLPDDALIAAVQGIGGGGPWEYVIERTTEQGIPQVTDPRRRVVKLLSEFTGKDVTALVRSEAAGATAEALLLAADIGIPTVDGGITGRAVPEVQQSIPWINGIASIPTAIITPWGDEIIIRKAVDEYRVEDISRAVAVASGGDAYISMTPMSGDQIGRGVLAGVLADAELFGRTVREARSAGADPIAALISVADGYLLFEGAVETTQERGERGFNWVEATLKGTNAFAGKTYKVYVKNENIVGWIDGKLSAVSPDYMYNLNPDTGESALGVGYGGYVVGEKIAMIGVRAHAKWRTQKGIDLIGPRHFGFDFDYVPIEKLQAALASQ
ncbi:MAG: DUF917 domain-containing protein [Pseudomonadota bacterium]